MVKKKLIEQLKNAKVAKDRKWIYTLVKWALENQTKEISDFNNRIGTAIHYAKGKYQEYWDNPRVKAQHKKSQEICIKNNKNYSEVQLKHRIKRKIISDLYNEGMLSKSSQLKINKELNKKLKQHKKIISKNKNK